MAENILEVHDLEIRYVTDEETVRAVNDITFSLERGESIGLVGETGAGKTTTALGIMGLVPDPPGEIVNGSILFEGEGSAEALGKADAPDPGWKDLHDFPGSYDLLEPGDTGGRSNCGSDPAAQ